MAAERSADTFDAPGKVDAIRAIQAKNQTKDGMIHRLRRLRRLLLKVADCWLARNINWPFSIFFSPRRNRSC